MHERRDDRSDRGRSRHGHSCDDRGRGGGDRHHDDCCSPERGSQRRDDCDRETQGRGPDTRFLQLEMSEVLYAEAESVTKQAFRELLLEECKVRFRERFGDQITGLAQLAVDELMQDVFASLDVEARIRQRSRDQDSRRERLSEILRAGCDDAAEGEGKTPEPNGEGGGGSSPESDEDR